MFATLFWVDNTNVRGTGSTMSTTSTIIAAADKATSFTYSHLPISDLGVEMSVNAKTGRKTVDKIMVQGEAMESSERFWTSLYARYGFNSAFTTYFTHEEIFERISKVQSRDQMRVCIERDDNNKGTVLGVSNPNKPIVVYNELMETLTRYKGQDVTYHNGVVESIHTPRNGSGSFQVSGDNFSNRFMLATPIDGYGTPNIYLSLLREVCQNGMVGMTKAFRSQLALGKANDDVTPSLTRALDGFGNDEGFAAIRQRLESSTTSWASVYETTNLYKLLVKCHTSKSVTDRGGVTPAAAANIRGYLNSPIDGSVEGDSGIGSQLLVAFHRMTGDVSRIYGLSNLDALSVKRQRTLPVKCTTYDLINFATEVATHYANPSGSRALNAWLGTIITEEFDLENTKTSGSYESFADFHLDRKELTANAI